MIIADASAVVALLLRTGSTAAEAALFDPDRPVHAPHLLDVEVASAFRRLAVRGEIDAARGATMLALLGDLFIERHDHRDWLPRVWALRDTVSAYDATYVALAETLGATLFTRDGRLARAAGPLVAVELM